MIHRLCSFNSGHLANVISRNALTGSTDQLNHYQTRDEELTVVALSLAIRLISLGGRHDLFQELDSIKRKVGVPEI